MADLSWGPRLREAIRPPWARSWEPKPPFPPGRRRLRWRNIGSEGTFWRVWRVLDGVVGRRRDWWRIRSCEGERLGNGRRSVICSGRVERGVLSGRERLREDFSGAMGLRIMLTRLSIVDDRRCRRRSSRECRLAE